MALPDFGPKNPDPNLELVAKVNTFYLNLTSPESASRVTPELAESLRGQIKKELEEAGVDFKAVENEAMQANLAEYQFRSYDSGKGLALSTATSQSCLEKFDEWAWTVSKDEPKLKEGGELSRCRGMMQILANTIAFAAGAIDADRYVRELKWRVGASYERPLFNKMKAEPEGDTKDQFRAVLRNYRIAYDIPFVKEGNEKIRKEYSGYHRAEPEAMLDFWLNLKRIVSQK